MQRYITLIMLALVLLGAAVAGLFYILRQTPGSERAQVELAIEAPEEITSGDEVAFSVRYRNATRVPLTDVELFFRYPDGAVPAANPDQRIETVRIGSIAPEGAGAHVFLAHLMAPKGSALQAHAELAYRSVGVSSFRKTADVSVYVADIPFLLNFTVPQKAVSGERITYFLKYINLSKQAYPGTFIRLRYPDGFGYQSAEPAPTDGEQAWDVGEVAQGGEGLLTIRGTLTGNEGDTRKVHAEIGFMRGEKFFAYSESSFETVIAPSPLWVSIELTEPESAIGNLGGRVLGRVRYKNNTDVPIKDVVIKAEFSGEMFKKRGITAERGFFDSARNTILWTPANVKELLFLDPGREYALLFQAALADAFPIRQAQDANFTAGITAIIESINAPPYLALNKITSTAFTDIKIETAPLFAAKGFYYDDVSGVVNSGPIPPKVDTRTLYTVHWRVAVPANNLENVEVRTTLPTGVTPTGVVRSYYTENLPTFNEITGEIAWFIPRVPANTGVTSPAYEAVFQIALTPSVTQLGQTVELVRESVLGAVDAFTGRAVLARSQPIRTNLPDDQKMAQGSGAVVP